MFAVASLLGLFAGQAAAQPLTVGLSAQQAERLQALGIPIVVPAYVPPGFAVETVHTEAGSGAPLDGPAYVIRYARDDGTCFTIETAAGGLGGPVPEHRQILHPVAFVAPPETPYHLYWTGEAPEWGFRPHSLFSDWMGGPPVFYRLAGGGAVSGACRRLAREVAVRIVESLRVVSLSDDPFDFAAYDRHVLNRPFAITSRRGASPCSAARHVLEALGLRLDARAVASVTTCVKGDGGRNTADVLVTYAGLCDDSVRGRRHLLRMRADGGRWVLVRVGSQVTCRPGRGHQTWSQERCL